MRIIGFIILMMSFTSPAFGDSDGVLNPEEMSMGRTLERARRGEVNMVICAQGYFMTKSGRHSAARTIFEACANKGWTGAMTWMSYMETNGFGGPENPRAAAHWDKMAAENGDSIGAFNYGLDLLRGHGVARDDEMGRALIDRAAKDGVSQAQELQRENYDVRAVTPDSDEWRYQKLF